MSEIKINQAYFEKNLPVPDAAFVKQSMDRFKACAGHPSRPRFKTALVLGILFALLLAAALAAGLLYSQRFEFIRSARQAVMAAYGLSQDELSLYMEAVTDEESGGMTVIYTPTVDSLAHLGTYTAVLKPGQKPQVTWSEKVMVFAPPNATPDKPYVSPYGLPGKGDLSYEQALELACQAVEAEYGVTREMIDAGEMLTHFITRDPETFKWFFWFFPGGEMKGEAFSVTMDAKDGTILYVIKDAPGNG